MCIELGGVDCRIVHRTSRDQNQRLIAHPCFLKEKKDA